MMDTTELSPDPSLFGVTLRDVQNLLPYAVLVDEVNDIRTPAASRGISTHTVNQWIELVAAEVNARIAGYEKITDEARALYVRKAGRTLVINGAAAYWERARTSDHIDSTQTYYEDLLRRYNDMLDALAVQVKDWSNDPSDSGGGPSGCFPAARFPDRIEF